MRSSQMQTQTKYFMLKWKNQGPVVTAGKTKKSDVQNCQDFFRVSAYYER